MFDGGGGSGGPGDERVGDVVGDGQRRSLSRQTQFNGTLGYAGSYTVLGQAQGTVTWLPKVGQVIGQGQVLYRVDEAPVVLLYGRIPAYRALAEGDDAVDRDGCGAAEPRPGRAGVRGLR